MKVALLGKGKTGGKVIELMEQAKIEFTIFDSSNKPTLEKLKNHDVVISFLPGEAFTQYISILLDSKIPVVCGSTGMTFPQNFNATLKEFQCTWIYATNFSLGMNLVQQMILIMSKANKILKNYSFSLSEIHHTRKLDSPSGTALSWKAWADHEMQITSERIGDVSGIHELVLSTDFEKISIRHESLDRKIFAEGALFAADKIINDKSLAHGLHLFQDVVLSVIGVL
jgi:4-hydroxy-tetrahydrodipicolinate reductase